MGKISKKPKKDTDIIKTCIKGGKFDVDSFEIFIEVSKEYEIPKINENNKEGKYLLAPVLITPYKSKDETEENETPYYKVNMVIMGPRRYVQETIEKIEGASLEDIEKQTVKISSKKKFTWS